MTPKQQDKPWTREQYDLMQEHAHELGYHLLTPFRKGLKNTEKKSNGSSLPYMPAYGADGKLLGSEPIEHQHIHNIPVEWAWFSTIDGTLDRHNGKIKKVTKLRCACGDEVSRG